MLTSKQREAAFRADLTALLADHRAELVVTDDGRPWGLQKGICNITMMNDFDDNGQLIADYVEFNL